MASSSPALPELTRYNIRSMKTSTAVTHMSRFAMTNTAGTEEENFDAKKALKKAANVVAAAQRFGEGKKGIKQELRADFVAITGHDNGQLQIRNFDTGLVTGSGKHFNNLPVSYLQGTNSYVYTILDRDFRSPTAPEETHNVYVWDMTNMSEIHMILEGHADRVTTLTVPLWNEFSPVSGGIDKKIIIWDIRVSRHPQKILDQHTMMIKQILATKHHIISGSSDQHIRIWDWNGDHIQDIEPGSGGGPIQHLHFTKSCANDGGDVSFISGCGAGFVREFLLTPTAQLTVTSQFRSGKGQVSDVSSCTTTIISATSESGYVSFYNRASKALGRFQLHDSSVRRLDVDPRRKWVLTGTDDGLISVFDYLCTEKLLEQPVQLFSIQGHRSGLKSVILDYRPDGSWDRVFSCAGDNSILVIDFDTTRGSMTSELCTYTKLPKYAIRSWDVIVQTGTLITVAEGSPHCDLWNTTSKHHKSDYSDGGILEVGNLSSTGKHITAVVYNEQDMKILVAATDGMLHTFDVSLYDESGYGGEELIVKSRSFELRGLPECLTTCFNDFIGVGMSRTQHGTVEVLNYLGGDELFHFATQTTPKRIDFVGKQDEGIAQVIAQLSNGTVAIYDLSGRVLATLVDPQNGTGRRVSVSEFNTHPVLTKASSNYIVWMDDSYSPLHALLITHSERIIRETRIVITGGSELNGVRVSFTTTLPSTITCAEKMYQTGMHCVAGCTNGNFYILDKKGEVVATILWDGGTILGPLKEEEIAPARGRRESFTNDALGGVAPPASCVSCTLSGRYVTCGYEDGMVCMWDTTHRRTTQRLVAHSSPILRSRVLPQMMRIVTISKSSIRFDDLHDRYDLLEGRHQE